jgi:hypothetical protein
MGRRPFAVAFAFLSLLAFSFAPPARAGDEVPPEDESGFGYSNEDVAIADAGLTDGYKVATGAEADALVKSTKGEPDRVRQGEGGRRGPRRRDRARGDVPRGRAGGARARRLNSRSEPSRLAEAAAAKGWTVGPSARRRTGSSRPAPRRRARRWSRRSRVRGADVATKSSSAIEDANGPLAGAMARIAYRIDPKNARANLITGSFMQAQAAQAEDKAMMDDAIARFRAALAKDATGTLTPREATSARGELGGALLNKGGPSAEARDLLKEAVKSLDAVPRDVGIGYRYNLACAHARLKELDEAFPPLEKALADNKEKPIQGISHWRKDPDFEPLKGDPRWAKLLETYPDSGHPTGD